MNLQKYIQYISEKSGNTYFLSVVGLITFLFIMIFSASTKYSDFAGYYFGSTLLLEGNFQTAYDTYSLNQYIYNQGYRDIFVSYTPFPPFTSVLFSPFTFIPIAFSKILFNLLSSLIFTFTLYRTIKHFSLLPFILIIVPLLFLIPLKNNIFFGQAYLLLFALLMEGFLAYSKGKYRFSSLWWGIAILFKIFPGIIFLFLLLKKEYRQVVYLFLTCILLLMISLIINGADPWIYYLEILPRLNNGELNSSFTYYFQSAFMLLKNIFIYDSLMNPEAIYPSLFLFIILLSVFKAFIITICATVTLRNNSKNFISFSLWILASILLSPNGSTYSLILLLIPFLALFKIDIPFNKSATIFLLIFLMCNIPIHYLHNDLLFLKFLRLYLLLILFTLIAFIIKARISYKLLPIIFLLAAFPESFRLQKEEDKSDYLLNEEKHILIHDYKIKNNQLTYCYWTEDGSKEERTTLKVSNLENSKDLLLKENQIYYKGKQLTNSTDRKRKPMLMDNKYVIYLSDKNRGIGFYTLRKVSVL